MTRSKRIWMKNYETFVSELEEETGNLVTIDWPYVLKNYYKPAMSPEAAAISTFEDAI